MGNVSTDQRNPGARRVRPYSVAKGYNGNVADAMSGSEERGVGFLLLKNCLVDKRLGELVRRPGSVTETIDSGLGLPLGMGEYTSAAQTGGIPVNRSLLVNFSGARFFYNSANVWSEATLSANVSFATSRPSTFAKLGSNLFIAGGRPAKWGGPGTEIERVGIPAPVDPITITSTANLGSITLSEGTRYVYTYYDWQTGLESDWSPPSEATGPVTDKQIAISIPPPPGGNYDSFRIYRYLDGGAFPYLVNIQGIAVQTYSDNAPDSGLTARASPRYEKIPPPTSYICAKYAQCMWYVDASDPHKLVFSKPYTGDDHDLEYFPIDNYVISNEPITALLVVPGKMLVFHPRSISYVSGFSVDDFVFQPWISGTGTVFGSSVATNGAEIAFLAEQGFVAVPTQGGMPRHISREIDHELQPLLAGSYNAEVNCSGAWNPALRQFVWSFLAQSTAGSPWEELGTGDTSTAAAGWETTPGAVTDTWEELSGAPTSDTLRVKIWGYSPELSSKSENQWHEFTFAAFADDNLLNKKPLFLFHPQPSADLGDPQQDRTFIGYWDGTEGKVLAAFRKDLNRDDGNLFTAEWLTNRISPGQDNGGFCLFQKIGFDSTYSDPTADTFTTLKYLKDFESPHLRTYAPQLITITDTTELKKFPRMQAKYIHLYGIDTSESQAKPLLSKFFIHFRERFRRES